MIDSERVNENRFLQKFLKGTGVALLTIILAYIICRLPVALDLNPMNHSLAGVLAAFILMIGGRISYCIFKDEEI